MAITIRPGDYLTYDPRNDKMLLEQERYRQLGEAEHLKRLMQQQIQAPYVPATVVTPESNKKLLLL